MVAEKVGNFTGIARNGIFDPATTTAVRNASGATTYTRTRFVDDTIFGRGMVATQNHII
jgi:peptidoglycan hydrolase-like protein with peptidoglycan-binding domain